jgi:hypothetical protein
MIKYLIQLGESLEKKLTSSTKKLNCSETKKIWLINYKNTPNQ